MRLRSRITWDGCLGIEKNKLDLPAAKNKIAGKTERTGSITKTYRSSRLPG